MAAPQGRILPHIRAWRDKRWLTQEMLERMSGVKVATIQRAEHGGPVSNRTAWALAHALDVTPDQLCYEVPDVEASSWQ